ncbi:substrate-binding periplasmic protein [Roseateles sp. P5_E7]
MGRATDEGQRLMLDRRQALVMTLTAGLAPGAHAAEALQLVSADFPALISPQGPDAPGPLGDFLVQLCALAGWSLQPQFYPFARATQMARSGSRVLMAPLSRTPAREAQYRWLLPLFAQRYVLMGLRSRWPTGIDTTEARNATVLALRGTVGTESLQRQGFTRLAMEGNYAAMLRRIDEGSADLLYAAVPVVTAALRAAGRDLAHWVQGASFDQHEVWLVGSADLQPAEVQALAAALDKLKRDGGHQRLLQRIGAQPPGAAS